jgi:ribosomal protein S18 acetylase RimI-like enzyme
MHLFRRLPDLSQAYVRIATDTDLARISTLLRDAGRRYYGLSGPELPHLLNKSSAVIFETPAELLALAMVGWISRGTTWLRCVALARGLHAHDGVEALLPMLHSELQFHGVHHIFYAGDDTADSWLVPVLKQCGYVHDTTVIVYEKRLLHIPSQGNQYVHVRPAHTTDLAALVALDEQCFEAHWAKTDGSMHTAVHEGSFFVVAQLEAQLVGYAYATSHFGGRLVHLVRIAVTPRLHGQGIGARLLAEVVGFARQQQTELVTLNTQQYNEQAQQLYRWFGFTPSGESQLVLRYDL